MKKTAYILLVLALCLSSAFKVQLAQAAPAAAFQTSALPAGSAAAIPLANVLNPDGTINLSAGLAGALDLRGWQLAGDLSAGPRFVPAGGPARPDASAYPLPPAGAPGDENWGLAGYGVGGNVRALAVDGSGNVYVGGQFTGITGCTGCAYIAKWNGSTWSPLGAGMAGTGARVLDLAWVGGSLYAAGIFTSAGACATGCVNVARWDGSVWNELSGGANGTVNALAVYGSDVYVAGSFTSPSANIAKWDGSAWSVLGSGTNNVVSDLAVDSAGILYAGGYFSQAGGVAVFYIAKWDGLVWSGLAGGMNAPGGYVYALAVDKRNHVYAGGDFTTAGGVSATRLAMWDGSVWSALGSGANGSISTLLVDNAGNLYAGGAFSSPGAGIARWDGSAWHTLGTGVSVGGAPYAYALALDTHANLFVGGGFGSAGGLNVTYFARWLAGDGVCGLAGGGDYTLYANNLPVKLHVNTGGLGDLGCVTLQRFNKHHPNAASDQLTNYYWSLRGLNDSGGAASGFDVNLTLPYASGNAEPSLCRWTGSAWDACSRSAMDSLNHTVTLNNVTAFSDWTVANRTPYPRPPAGFPGDENWAPVGGSTVSGSLIAVVIADGSGNLYVGGGFTTIATCADCKYIAKWDGSAWSPLGTGMNNQVRELIMDASGNLYAGGQFTTAGACLTGCAYIAKWDPVAATWSAVGGGMSNDVEALVFDSSGNLYAGGAFTAAGTCNAAAGCKGVAKWNGVSWSALGTGTDNPSGSRTVGALVIDSAGNLYAGGYFTVAGGRTVNGVARWSNNAWYPLGTGIGGTSPYILGLGVDSRDNLYIGGVFTTAGGVTVNNVAKWDGAAWSALGSGANAYVEVLLADGAGNIYAGGGFSSIGGVTTNGIARWDGSAWNAMGSGMGGTNPFVWALALDPHGNLYAGGLFDSIGSMTTYRFAKWTAGSGVCNLSAGSDYTLYLNNKPIVVHINSLGSGAGALACLDAQRFNKNHPLGGAAQQTGSYWSLRALDAAGGAASGFDVNVTMTYDPLTNTDPSLCRLSGSQWGCAATSYDAVAKTVTLNNVTEFSEWTVGKSAPTAVQLSAFEATLWPGLVLVNWQTDSELGVIGFNLYRSLPGQSGHGRRLNADLILAQDAAAFGSSYSFLDLTAPSGQAYVYWLEVVGPDGSTWSGPLTGLARFGLFMPIVKK